VSPRRVVIGWLALVALYTALTHSEAINAAGNTTTTWVQRLSDPYAALIPNRAGKTSTEHTPNANTSSGSGSDTWRTT